jgi:hypothetical protein
METDWILLKDPLSIFEMEFKIPKNAKFFLIIEGVKGGTGEREVENFAARGLRISEWRENGAGSLRLKE